MTLIISKPGMKAKKVESSSFEKEGALQKYIYDNPESLPLDELKEDIRLLIVAREFPTDSGPIDAIGFDSDGEVYIIETKLYKNPDKRKVVAQVLDYGAALTFAETDSSAFLLTVENNVSEKFRVGLIEQLQDFFELNEEEVKALIENVKSNFSGGRFRFVVLMDELEPRLKNLIRFINQNSSFDLFGVELKYYKYEDYEIVIPKLYGAEVKKQVSKPGRTGGGRKQWDENLFFEEAGKNLSVSELSAIRKLFDFSKTKADFIKWGTGTATGSFNPIFEKVCPRSIFTVWTYGKLSFNLRWVHDTPEMVKYRDEITQFLKDDFGWNDFYWQDEGKPTRIGFDIPIKNWSPVVDKLIEKIGKIILAD